MMRIEVKSWDDNGVDSSCVTGVNALGLEIDSEVLEVFAENMEEVEIGEILKDEFYENYELQNEKARVFYNQTISKKDINYTAHVHAELSVPQSPSNVFVVDFDIDRDELITKHRADGWDRIYELLQDETTKENIPLFEEKIDSILQDGMQSLKKVLGEEYLESHDNLEKLMSDWGNGCLEQLKSNEFYCDERDFQWAKGFKTLYESIEANAKAREIVEEMLQVLEDESQKLYEELEVGKFDF